MLRVIKAEGECHGLDITRYVIRDLGNVLELSHVRDVEDAERLIAIIGASLVGKRIEAIKGQARIIEYREAYGVTIDIHRADAGQREGNCRKGITPAVPHKAYVEGIIRLPVCQKGGRYFLRKT